MDRADRPQRRLGPARPHRSARTSRRVLSGPRPGVTWGHGWAPPPLGGGALLPEKPGPAQAAARKPPAAALPLRPQWTLLVASPSLELAMGLSGRTIADRGGRGGAPGTASLLGSRLPRARAECHAPPRCRRWARRAVPSRLRGRPGRGVRTRPLDEVPAWRAQWAGRASPTRSGGGRDRGIWTRPLSAGEKPELNVGSPCAQWALSGRTIADAGGGEKCGRSASRSVPL